MSLVDITTYVVRRLLSSEMSSHALILKGPLMLMLFKLRLTFLLHVCFCLVVSFVCDRSYAV